VIRILDPSSAKLGIDALGYDTQSIDVQATIRLVEDGELRL